MKRLEIYGKIFHLDLSKFSISCVVCFVKKCARCQDILEESEFRYDKKNKSQLNSWCKKCHSSYHSDYLITKKKEVNEKLKEWKKENPDQIAKIRAKSLQKPENKEKARVRAELRRLILSPKNKQSYLGCSSDEFRSFIQNQFLEGMDWSGYGKIWNLRRVQESQEAWKDFVPAFL